jgi:hypothetical protein
MTDREAAIATLFKDRLLVVGDCWERQGGRVRGYGQISYKGRNTLVHRLALSLALGRPLQANALHRCDNPPCFRPSHLYEGTMQDNCDDRDARSHTARHERHGNARLTAADVADIRSRYIAGHDRWHRGNGWLLAAEYGITRTHVLDIVASKVWKVEA